MTRARHRAPCQPAAPWRWRTQAGNTAVSGVAGGATTAGGDGGLGSGIDWPPHGGSTPVLSRRPRQGGGVCAKGRRHPRRAPRCRLRLTQLRAPRVACHYRPELWHRRHRREEDLYCSGAADVLGAVARGHWAPAGAEGARSVRQPTPRQGRGWMASPAGCPTPCPAAGRRRWSARISDRPDDASGAGAVRPHPRSDGGHRGPLAVGPGRDVGVVCAGVVVRGSARGAGTAVTELAR
jgi:hypothetical protein